MTTQTAIPHLSEDEISKLQPGTILYYSAGTDEKYHIEATVTVDHTPTNQLHDYFIRIERIYVKGADSHLEDGDFIQVLPRELFWM